MTHSTNSTPDLQDYENFPGEYKNLLEEGRKYFQTEMYF